MCSLRGAAKQELFDSTFADLLFCICKESASFLVPGLENCLWNGSTEPFNISWECFAMHCMYTPLKGWE